jgi:hypothetical protein
MGGRIVDRVTNSNVETRSPARQLRPSETQLIIWTEPRGLFEDVEQSFGAEDAVAAGFADLLDDSKPDQAPQGSGRRVVGHVELGLRFAHRDERIGGEQIEQSQCDP